MHPRRWIQYPSYINPQLNCISIRLPSQHLLHTHSPSGTASSQRGHSSINFIISKLPQRIHRTPPRIKPCLANYLQPNSGFPVQNLYGYPNWNLHRSCRHHITIHHGLPLHNIWKHIQPIPQQYVSINHQPHVYTHFLHQNFIQRDSQGFNYCRIPRRPWYSVTVHHNHKYHHHLQLQHIFWICGEMQCKSRSRKTRTNFKQKFMKCKIIPKIMYNWYHHITWIILSGQCRQTSTQKHLPMQSSRVTIPERNWRPTHHTRPHFPPRVTIKMWQRKNTPPHSPQKFNPSLTPFPTSNYKSKIKKTINLKT